MNTNIEYFAYHARALNDIDSPATFDAVVTAEQSFHDQHFEALHPNPISQTASELSLGFLTLTTSLF